MTDQGSDPTAEPPSMEPSTRTSPAGPRGDGHDKGDASGPSSLWDRLRNARVPQLLGVYAGAGFGVLQVADIFLNRLGLPDWTFFGLLLVLLAGLPVVVATALVQSEGSSLRARELLNWRNTSLAGVLAVGGLTLLVGGVMGARALGLGPVGSLVAAGVLERDEAILVGDFQAPAGDELLAGAITEAFRIDFEQSRVVRVVPPGVVRDALLRMERAPEGTIAQLHTPWLRA